MLNKKANLSLKFNKSLNNLSGADSGPFTPLEQTMKTPLDHPWAANNQPFNNAQYPNPNLQTMATPAPPGKPETLYANPHYNESDDFLVVAAATNDASMENGATFKTTRTFTLNFSPNFDSLVMSIYSHILSQPTTTPFSGALPPSGLVSKVANETMNHLYNTTLDNPNPPLFDYQGIITSDALLNQSFQPIFLQLIRKRFLDLCMYQVEMNKNSSHSQTQNQNQNHFHIQQNQNPIQTPAATPRKLPESTTVSITSSQAGGVTINSYSGNNVRHSSISNLSLTELNISNYNASNTDATSDQNSITRSRNSSLSLRKQSLTRNNSHTSTSNWLHVGNINSIRPYANGNQSHFNGSTDSLQSMQDYVPQSLINRSTGAQPATLNSMMSDYQTPPTSNKNSLAAQGGLAQPPQIFGGSTGVDSLTPPNSANVLQNDITMSSGGSMGDYDDFNFYQERSRSGSVKSGVSNSFPRPLTINTDSANTQALNALNGVTGGPGNADQRSGSFGEIALDSPFMSATTPQDDYGYFCNGFASLSGGSISASSSIDASPVMSHTGNNDSLLPAESAKIHLPNAVSLSDKKRDSLKLKRGIH